MADNGDLMTANGANRDGSDTITHLEQRVRRLEDAVAQLQDTRPLEERVVERVTAKARLNATRETAGSKPDLPPPPPPEPVRPPIVATPVVTAPPSSPLTLLGLVLDSLSELRSMTYMYLDRRYRMPWTGYTLPPLVLVLIVTSLFWFPGLSWVFNFSPMAGALANVPIVLLLSYFWYRLLTWEAKRYRDAVAGLPPAPRY
jgi:hypothetical protein